MISKALFAYDRNDSTKTRSEKSTILLAALSCCLGGCIWAGVYYVIFGFGLISLILASYVILVFSSLTISHLCQNHYPAVYAHLIGIMCIPALIQWNMGGMFDSGFILMLGFCAPITALKYFRLRYSGLWLLFCILNLIITMGFDDLFYANRHQVSESTKTFLATINFSALSVYVYMFSSHFLVSANVANAKFAKHLKENAVATSNMLKNIQTEREKAERAKVDYAKKTTLALRNYPETLKLTGLLNAEMAVVIPSHNPRITQGSQTILDRAVAKGLIITGYRHDGIYLNFHKGNILRSQTVSYNDDLGIPLNIIDGIEKPQPNPITLGYYALQMASKFFSSESIDYRKQLWKVRAWMLANQKSDGSWPVPYEHEFFKGRSGGIMPGNWVSALGQGYCISALVRCQKIRPDKQISRAILRGLQPFAVPVAQNGILRLFEKQYPFYEEYPTPKPSFVLNGFMFSLLGLYDASACLKDDSARSLYDQGLDTLERVLPFYDLGDRSAYDLTHLQKGNENLPPNPTRLDYHDTHIQLLSAISSLEHGRFQNVLNRWILYRFGFIALNN